MVESGAAGILELEGALGDEFSAAIKAIFTLGDHGRLVVSGMGKSGHVARKIAATLAST
ncbi:MAG: KpsF/GutQ family sugar-phosphate isomerase, partial [Gammaproteobacteria bacterium]